MKDAYKEENKDLINSFMENTFFKNWRGAERVGDEIKFPLQNYNSVEFALGYACDLRCKYCYYNRFGKELYQNEKVDGPTVVKNVEKFMNFLYKNDMLCNIDIFSGEAFILPYIWDIFDIMIEYMAKMPMKKRMPGFSIPSNLSFLKTNHEEKLKKLREYQAKFEKIGTQMTISGSFDGPFMDNFNRPFVNKKLKYTEEFYTNFVSNMNSMRLGAHPMIYSNNIEYWIENLIWFMGETRSVFYLLEVRNLEWTAEQAAQIFYMGRFAVNYVHKFYMMNTSEGKNFPDYVRKLNNGFNLLIHPFNIVGRGLGCSLQSTLNVNMHNLSLIPCHRTSYSHLTTGRFDFDDEGGYNFEPENVEMYIAEQVSDATEFAPCTGCPIKRLCGGTCLGSNYESTGDLYTVPPSFCRLSHAKIGGIIKGWEDVGWLNYFYRNADPTKRAGIDFLLNEFKDM